VREGPTTVRHVLRRFTAMLLATAAAVTACGSSQPSAAPPATATSTVTPAPAPAPAPATSTTTATTTTTTTAAPTTSEAPTTTLDCAAETTSALAALVAAETAALRAAAAYLAANGSSSDSNEQSTAQGLRTEESEWSGLPAQVCGGASGPTAVVACVQGAVATYGSVDGSSVAQIQPAPSPQPVEGVTLPASVVAPLIQGAAETYAAAVAESASTAILPFTACGAVALSRPGG
jgi:hypothetical protein